jgi:hypothetical protein
MQHYPAHVTWPRRRAAPVTAPSGMFAGRSDDLPGGSFASGAMVRIPPFNAGKNPSLQGELLFVCHHALREVTMRCYFTSKSGFMLKDSSIVALRYLLPNPLIDSI